MAAGKFVRAAARLLRILGDGQSAIVGGMAVNAHGYVRGTRDVDVMVTIPLAEARQLLLDAGVVARLFKGDVTEGDIPCLRGVVAVGSRAGDAVPFDVLPALVRLEPQESVELRVGGRAIRVVDVLTLIRLKVKAGSSRDLHDVAILSHLHPEWTDRALALATSEGRDVGERLAAVMRDPRVRAQAREARQQERALRAFARRRTRK
jgi:hypothetical protein